MRNFKCYRVLAIFGGLNDAKGLGRAVDHSTALLQTRASAINAHGSSDYGFAESLIAMHDPRGH